MAKMYRHWFELANSRGGNYLFYASQFESGSLKSILHDNSFMELLILLYDMNIIECDGNVCTRKNFYFSSVSFYSLLN